MDTLKYVVAEDSFFRRLRKRVKPLEQRADICQKRTNAVNYRPRDPDSFKPIPRLIGLVLVI